MADTEIEDLIAFFQLTAEDEQGRRQVAKLVRQHGSAALDDLYAHLRQNPHTRHFFPTAESASRAQGHQLRHWLNLFDNGVTPQYHAAAVGIGHVHARIGLDPKWYLGGYAIMMDRLLVKLMRSPLAFLSKPRLTRSIRAMFRHAVLDMTVALGGYFRKESEKQGAVVNQLGTAMKELAAGNFAYDLEDLPEGFAELKHDFTRMRDSVRQLLENLAAASHSVRVCSTEIRNASDDLALRNEQQASSIADITRDAVSGGEVASKAAVSMAAISEASAKVGHFSDAIDSIAFQTNLLALNAGVEAARAGDAGKGFAVVASEVRSLSARAADTAREIKALSTLNAEQITNGAERVQSMGELLKSVADRIEKSNQMIQSNAALSEQTNAATRSLVEQADLLDKLVSRFNTRRSDMQPARFAPLNLAALPGETIAHEPAPSAPRAPRRPAMAQAASSAAADAEGWDEF